MLTKWNLFFISFLLFFSFATAQNRIVHQSGIQFTISRIPSSKYETKMNNKKNVQSKNIYKKTTTKTDQGNFDLIFISGMEIKNLRFEYIDGEFLYINGPQKSHRALIKWISKIQIPKVRGGKTHNNFFGRTILEKLLPSKNYVEYDVSSLSTDEKIHIIPQIFIVYPTVAYRYDL